MLGVVTFHPRTSEFVAEKPDGGAPPPDLTAAALRQRVRQQEILADLGVRALQGTPFPELLDLAARLTAEGLAAEFAKVLEFMPSEGRFLVRAGVGWEPGVVGAATIGADIASPAGYALRTGKAVISNHLESEERFRTPELLLEHGIRRAMNVILQGDGEPYGVLEVDSRNEGEFSATDISFLQGAANILGMAIYRQRAERNLTAALERHQILTKEVNHRINNSLQIVASMLHLQTTTTQSEEVRHALRDASSRIAAIARAHQRLYGSDQVGVVDLGAYLADICNDLCKAMPDCVIHVTAAPGVQSATDTAIPVALLVNELITNSAKYAYPDAGCEVWLDVARSDGAISIAVRDRGIGLPADFDMHSGKRLGMRLVNALSAQVQADLQVIRGNPGTEFLLTIPIKAPRAE
ncbi:MAG: histidine kinase dimerization/phosphoacceptor domain -containing protein [Xanthobacteraceae bacterium]